MCLDNIPTHVEKILKNKSDTFKTYKVLSYDRDLRQLVSPFQRTKWKSGIKKSSSRIKKPSLHNVDINAGIHVLTTKNAALEYMNGFCVQLDKVIVELTCQKKHLIGVNLNDHQMVFSEVHLSEKEYDKAMKNFSPV